MPRDLQPPPLYTYCYIALAARPTQARDLYFTVSRLPLEHPADSLHERSYPSRADRLYWPKILFVLYIPLRFITVVIKTKPHDPAQQADKSTAHSRIIRRVRKIHVRPSAWKNSAPTGRILMKALHLSFFSKTCRGNSSFIKI